MTLITVSTTNQKIIQGIDTIFAQNEEMPIGAETYPVAKVKTALQAENDANAALERTRSELKAQMAEAETVRKAARAIRRALRGYILATRATKGVKMVDDLGLGAPKSAVRTVESKANAILRAQATRVARGTLGKRKKLAIKGVPHAVVDLSASDGSAAPRGTDAAPPVPVSPGAPSHS